MLLDSNKGTSITALGSPGSTSSETAFVVHTLVAACLFSNLSSSFRISRRRMFPVDLISPTSQTRGSLSQLLRHVAQASVVR